MPVANDDTGYTEYVTAKLPWLRRTAYLLCQDWHRADDLLQTAITKLYINWQRAERVENIDGYARTILVNTFLAEQRSPWWKRVVPHREDLDSATKATDLEAILDLRAALSALPPKQRATVVLRYYNDLSITETAEALCCSEGTVKSQTSRALVSLRHILETRDRGNRTTSTRVDDARTFAATHPGGMK